MKNILRGRQRYVLATTGVITGLLILTALFFAHRLQHQARVIDHWMVAQNMMLADISSGLIENDQAALQDAVQRTAALKEQLEQVLNGSVEYLPGDPEFLLLIKSWHIPVSSFHQLLLSGMVQDAGRKEARELMSTIRNAAGNAQQWLNDYRSKVFSKEHTFRIMAYLLTLIWMLGWISLLWWSWRKIKDETTRFDQELQAEKERNTLLTRFIEDISAGNYNAHLPESDDELTTRLRHMRDKLRQSAEEEARRNRTTQGLAQLGDILHAAAQSSGLYDRIIKFMVTFTRSNQGGLFLRTEDEASHETYLNLVAAYAFERKKFITRRIEIGEGLVGQCFQEGEKIFLAKVPEDYIHITSGLGDAPPRSILLVPLKTEKEVLGVMELASFQVYDTHEIELIEKLAGSIATTLATVQINEKTRLLLEHSQQQTEEMRAQEEEMRQNMEELAATQEEMARKEKEYLRRIAELENQLQSMGVRT
jgi:GAF domain-containing protein